jgi:hypothetical protein
MKTKAISYVSLGLTDAKEPLTQSLMAPEFYLNS